ncbi:MAG: aminotransferase class V-fold PLP-dependent enzyme, partial [Tabrizicola sp.]|nr:aminotransferase class V-fold PLP-dependent enzyme [Tabrizicola sp.]
EVIFTSGATEAAAVLSRVPEGRDILVDPTAHDCLWTHSRRGGRAPEGHVLAWGYANNETGIITDPPEPIDGKRLFDGAWADLLMLDIVQAVGKLPFSFAWSGADMAILSAHKFGGPKGVGALILRDGVEIGPFLSGGGQEMGRRAGTENLIGIAGMGAAATAAARDLADGVWDRVAQVRNILEQALSGRENETISVGNGLARLPNTLCLIAPGWKGETQVMAMDLAGFAVSAGSACSSGKVRSSRVLAAMGYDARLSGQAIRLSIGPDATEDDVLRFADVWTAAYAKARSRAA